MTKSKLIRNIIISIPLLTTNCLGVIKHPTYIEKCVENKNNNTNLTMKSKSSEFLKDIKKRKKNYEKKLKEEQEQLEKERQDEERRKAEEQKKEPQYEEILVQLSFYTSTYEECGRTDGLTASGKYAIPYYTIAMDSSISFGTLVEIEGFGVMENMDTGNMIGIFYDENDNLVYNVDVYVGYDTERALELGRYITTAKILK